MFYKTKYLSPLGEIILASDGENIVGLWFIGQKYFGTDFHDALQPRDDLPVFSVARDWLDNYFAGLRPDASHLPLAPHGGAFRQAVWKILTEIPYGQVRTYGDIARQIAQYSGLQTMSPQAIGGAVSHNPISIIIPCHRVVGASGSLTGYAAGIATKIKLLQLEGVNTSEMFLPKAQ